MFKGAAQLSAQLTARSSICRLQIIKYKMRVPFWPDLHSCGLRLNLSVCCLPPHRYCANTHHTPHTTHRNTFFTFPNYNATNCGSLVTELSFVFGLVRKSKLTISRQFKEIMYFNKTIKRKNLLLWYVSSLGFVLVYDLIWWGWRSQVSICDRQRHLIHDGASRP